MNRSRSGRPDPVLEGVELLFHQKGGSASFGAKMALSLNGVDPGCMNSITGSVYRAKCSNIIHDTYLSLKGTDLTRFCSLSKLNFPIGSILPPPSSLTGFYIELTKRLPTKRHHLVILVLKGLSLKC
jgi:hypothetical protein